jgi:hypothetical protein
MVRYRKVYVRIWNDEKFITLSEHGKLIFVFLLTHPHMTMVGAMRATAAGLASELGIEGNRFNLALGEASERGMVKYDEACGLVMLPHWFRYNRPESVNCVKAWPAALEMLPECDLKNELIVEIKRFAEGLPEGFRQVFARTQLAEQVLSGVRRKAASLRWQKDAPQVMQTPCKRHANAMQAYSNQLKTKAAPKVFPMQEQEQDNRRSKPSIAACASMGDEAPPSLVEIYELVADEPQPQVEQEKPKPKKSRKKPPTDLTQHHLVRSHIQIRYMEHNGGLKAPWGPGTGNQLNMLLGKTPWSTDVWLRCVDNRFASDVNLSEDPLRWVSLLPNYQSGPLDRFGKCRRGNGASADRISADERRARNNARAIEEAGRLRDQHDAWPDGAGDAKGADADRDFTLGGGAGRLPN